MKLYWSELEWRWNEMSMKFYDILNLFNCFFLFWKSVCCSVGLLPIECYLYEIEIRTHKPNQIKSLFYVSFDEKKWVEEIWQRSVDILFMAFQAHTVRFKNTKCAKHVYVRIEAVGLLNYFTHTNTHSERERAHTTFHIICGIEIKIKRVHFGFNEFSCKKIDFLPSVFHC